MSAAPRLKDGDEAKRRRRNWAVAVVLAGLVVLFYAVTIVRMGRL